MAADPTKVVESTPATRDRDAAAARVEQANAAFAKMVADFQASPEQKLARDREQLAKLQSDPFHLNKKIGGSNAAANEEATILARIAVAEREAEAARVAAAIVDDKVDLPMIETTTEDSPLNMRDMKAVVDDLRALGLNDVCIGQAINGSREYASTIAEVKALFESRLADPEWVKKLNAGDRATRKEHTLICIVLNATPIDAPRE